MYNKSARYYDAIYHFRDYPAQSRQLLELIHEYNPNAKTLLDVACGTGKHLEFLREHYKVEGLDINPELLEIACRRSPGVTFHQENMVDFSLGTAFDVITCLFSSIGYVKILENMEKAVACMNRHLRPGGMLLIEPWFSPETYWVGKITANFVDQPDLKICWMYKSEREDRVSVSEINFLVGMSQGIEYFTERHEQGLFTHDEYLDAFRKVGLEVHYDPIGLSKRGSYVGLKNAI
jgi:ubiquinone/menaquinone biosynthesis C-methylase UbiE